jgi:hypothetical protein
VALFGATTIAGLAGCSGAEVRPREAPTSTTLADIAPVRKRVALPDQELPPEIEDAPLPEGGEPRWRMFVPYRYTTARFEIDTASLRLDADGVLRYVLRVTTDSGVVNTSFEGLRCLTKEWKPYALARPEGGWSRARGRWSRVDEGSPERARETLARVFLCEPSSAPVKDPAVVDRRFVAALKNPGPPPMR